jgi:hypothetical protein
MTTEGDSPLGNNFTMFFVAQNNTYNFYEGKYFSYVDGNVEFSVSSKNGLFTAYASDDSGHSGELSLTGAFANQYHIGMVKFHNKTLYLEYNNTLSNSLHISMYDHNTTHDQTDFTIGYKISAPSTNYFKGNLQEIIIYNTALDNGKIAEVKSYLNNKFKIY